MLVLVPGAWVLGWSVQTGWVGLRLWDAREGGRELGAFGGWSFRSGKSWLTSCRVAFVVVRMGFL